MNEIGIAEKMVKNPPSEFIDAGYFFSEFINGEGYRDNRIYFNLEKNGVEDWKIPFVIEYRLEHFRIEATNFGMYEAKAEDVEKDCRYWFKRAIATEIKIGFGDNGSAMDWQWGQLTQC